MKTLGPPGSTLVDVEDEGTWRLGYRRSLDGIRGLAIALVLVSHTLFDAVAKLGEEGVDLFFCLSGFLITSLLLEEHRSTGRIDFAAFFRRRLRRLLPALLVVLGATFAVHAYLIGWLPAAALALAVVFYIGNWVVTTGLGGLGYLGHTWSLSVEEQFYLVWPLATLLLLSARRWWRLSVVALLVLSACIWRADHSKQPLVLEFGSLTRAAPLLIGCGLAFLLHGRRTRTVSGWWTVPVFAMYIAQAWLPVPTPAEHVPAGLIAATLVGTAVSGRTIPWLEWGPLVTVGRRSYGLYLWHYPLMVPLLMRISHVPTTLRLTAAVLAVVAAWSLTCLSWTHIETRFKSTSAGRNDTPSIPREASIRGDSRR